MKYVASIALLGLTLVLPAAAQQERRSGQQKVGGDKTGLIPLTDMTAQQNYKGEDGGLYGGGKNEPPKAHQDAAKAETAKIKPLDADGKPADDGKIALLSIGMSNTTQEYSAFKRLADGGRDKSPKVVVVDGAQGGQDATRWDTADAAPWGQVDQRLQAAGVTAKQVQVVWLKQALARPSQYGAFPGHAKRMQEELAKTLKIARSRYPNLRVAYLSSRIYAGYAKSDLNPEPYSYEGAFAVRWLIQAQIRGDKELSTADAKVPLLLWGPYLWGDGMNPRRSDKLIWEAKDFGQDGTHPSDSGRDKVAQMLLTFFKNDTLARVWFQP